MVFCTAGAIATLLIGVSGQTLAQYHPPPQVYPRQALPPSVNADELPPLNAPVGEEDPRPPVGVGPPYQPSPGARYEQGTAAQPADPALLPPAGSPGYEGVQPQDYGRPAGADAYYGLAGTIRPSICGSDNTVATQREAR